MSTFYPKPAPDVIHRAAAGWSHIGGQKATKGVTTMSSILRRRPSAATLISCFALFMALGGVSYGFAAGSIDSREILNNTIRGKDVHQETLTGSDVKDGKLGGADLAADSLGGGHIAPDSLGGADVGPDSLGGADVNEASLGKVPAAAQADNASSAGNANTVDGVSAEALTIGRSGFLGTCEPGVTTVPHHAQRREPHGPDRRGLARPAHGRQPGAGPVCSDGRDQRAGRRRPRVLAGVLRRRRRHGLHGHAHLGRAARLQLRHA
jgi:hypothetical protein